MAKRRCYLPANEASIVTLLMERGADINAVDKHGCTLLHSAASHGNEPVMSLLLEHGADVNTRNVFGFTPLLCAREASIVKLLVKRGGADINVVDKYGSTLLHFAVTEGNESVAAFWMISSMT